MGETRREEEREGWRAHHLNPATARPRTDVLTAALSKKEGREGTGEKKKKGGEEKAGRRHSPFLRNQRRVKSLSTAYERGKKGGKEEEKKKKRKKPASMTTFVPPILM